MLNKNKKGVSQLIATILLIALVIVIAAIIFFWVRGFISEQIEKFGRPAEVSCGDANFDAELKQSGGETILYIFNKGNINIADFSIKTFQGGNSDTSSLGGGVLAGNVQIFKLSAIGEPETLKEKVESADKVIVIPEILGYIKGTSKTKSFSCEDTVGKLVKG